MRGSLRKLILHFLLGLRIELRDQVSPCRTSPQSINGLLTETPLTCLGCKTSASFQGCQTVKCSHIFPRQERRVRGDGRMGGYGEHYGHRPHENRPRAMIRTFTRNLSTSRGTSESPVYGSSFCRSALAWTAGGLGCA